MKQQQQHEASNQHFETPVMLAMLLSQGDYSLHNTLNIKCSILAGVADWQVECRVQQHSRRLLDIT